MNWTSVDWQTIFTFLAVVAAYMIGRKQNQINEAIHRVQDTVELYCSYLLIINKDQNDALVSSIPYIHVQNVGTRLIYLDKYIFNGREYRTDGQILPSTYSQALNNFYRIELPSNGEPHVSLKVFYHDLEGRQWSSDIIASKSGDLWNLKTLGRKAAINYN